MRKDGPDLLEVESRPDESLRPVRTVKELGPGWPPKSKSSVGLKADSVCQARKGEELLEKSCQGGDEELKDMERSRTNKSDISGAELYE